MLRTQLVGHKDRRGHCEDHFPERLSRHHCPRHPLSLQHYQSKMGRMKTELSMARFQAEVLWSWVHSLSPV